MPPAPGRLDPAVAAVRGAVRPGLQALDRTPGAPAPLVLVACSGGADSLALAAATASEAARAGVRAGAVVVDHGWSHGSAAVARGAARACRDLGLHPVEVVAAAPSAGETAARTARYAALDAAAERAGAAAVLLGHTRDDQAEQVLLGLARGSGARSLAGMPAARGRYRRPLLHLPRSTTARACEALGLVPWADPANADPAHARARVRGALLPALEAGLGPGVAAALARTADQLREDADALDDLAAALLERARHRGPPPAGRRGVELDAGVLAAAPAALRTRALRRAALEAGCPAGDLAREHVLAVQALVVAWRGQGPLHLPGRVEASRACGRVALWTPTTWAATSPRSS